MGLLDLATNTFTGVAEVAANTAKLGIGAAIAPFDDGKVFTDAAGGIASGLDKVGDTTTATDQGGK
jgi:hypothetical protein